MTFRKGFISLLIIIITVLSFGSFISPERGFSDPGDYPLLAVANNSAVEQSDSDSLSFLIPERSWRNTNLTSREITFDIAQKHPRRDLNPRKTENKVWGVGEKLVFSMDYGFYRAGTAVMAVTDCVTVNGDVCYRIQTKAQSNDFISAFYKVDDEVNSFIDVKGLYSRRFEKKLKEGKYKSDRFVDFYHERRIALNTQKKYAVTEIPVFVQDILSSLYYLRTFDIKIGVDHYIDVYADGKVYPLRIIIHGKEKVKVPAGTFNCIKVEPVLKSEGIFKQEGKLTVWMTDDDRKMPVKMTSKIMIGNIGANLESYQTGTSNE